MKAGLIFFLLMPLLAQAQINYSSKTSFKYSKEDGWVRIIEKEWFTVNNNGDTTYWAQTKEDTQQEDPGIKKDLLPVLVPNSVFTIGEAKAIKDTVNTVTKIIVPITNSTPIITHTIDTATFYYTKPKIVKKYKTRWKSSKPTVVKVTKYKTRWKDKKPIVIHVKERKPPIAKVTVRTIKAITYKKRLWCVLSKHNDVYVVEANTIKGAMKKVGLSAVSATQFSDFTIIR